MIVSGRIAQLQALVGRGSDALCLLACFCMAGTLKRGAGTVCERGDIATRVTFVSNDQPCDFGSAQG